MGPSPSWSPSCMALLGLGTLPPPRPGRRSWLLCASSSCDPGRAPHICLRPRVDLAHLSGPAPADPAGGSRAYWEQGGSGGQSLK